MTVIHTRVELAEWLMRSWGFYETEMARLERKRHPPPRDVLADLYHKRELVTKAINALEAFLDHA